MLIKNDHVEGELAMQCDSREARGERVADGFVHAIGVSASLVAVVALIVTAPGSPTPNAAFALAVYGVTMVAMLGLSAGYNLIQIAEWKEVLRRCDQAAIYTKIAGTYTPFALVKVGGVWGYSLLVTVWSVALLGAASKLTLGSGSEKISIALYLGLGWVGLLFIRPLADSLPVEALLLLGLGGLVYTTGVVFHLSDELPFRKAIWHLFVLGGTALHFAAVVVAIHSN